MNNEETVNCLNDLIETCKDGQKGFKEAADNVKRPDLKQLFNDIASDRARCVTELQQEVRSLGGDPEKSGSAGGTVHRAWMNIVGTFSGKDDHTILSECERGEDSAVESYQDALKKGLPANVVNLVQRQFNSVQNVHNRIKALRDAKSATPGR